MIIIVRIRTKKAIEQRIKTHFVDYHLVGDRSQSVFLHNPWFFRHGWRPLSTTLHSLLPPSFFVTEIWHVLQKWNDMTLAGSSKIEWHDIGRLTLVVSLVFLMHVSIAALFFVGTCGFYEQKLRLAKNGSRITDRTMTIQNRSHQNQNEPKPKPLNLKPEKRKYVVHILYSKAWSTQPIWRNEIRQCGSTILP